MQAKGEIDGRAYDQDVSSLEAECERYIEAARVAHAHVDDTPLLLWEALRADKRVLLEGAQGTMLDLDHGTYPYRHLLQPGGRVRLRGQRHRAGGAERGAGA